MMQAQESQSNIMDWVTDTILELQGFEFVEEDHKPECVSYGMFELTFNNAKRDQPFFEAVCQGTLYASGRIHLDTQNLNKKDYNSLQELVAYLDRIGTSIITWLDVNIDDDNETEVHS